MSNHIETRSGAFTFRRYTAADEPRVRSLWQAAFGREMPLALWRWKYEESPYGHQQLLCVGDDGTFAVMYGGIPYLANYKGETVRIGHMMDVMAHPDHRGWLYIKTVKAFFDTCAGPDSLIFLYGFPGERAYVIGKKLLKYRRMNEGLQFLTASPPALAKHGRQWCYRLFPIQNADARVDDLWRRCRDLYPFCVIRDGRFLKWRFLDHPLHRYEVMGYQSLFSKKLAGYAVLLREEKRVRIIDLFCEPEEKIVVGLLSRIGDHLAGEKIETLETWLPSGHPVTTAAISAGLEPHPEPIGIIPVGRSFHPDLSLEWASEKLYYTMADGDIF